MIYNTSWAISGWYCQFRRKRLLLPPFIHQEPTKEQLTRVNWSHELYIWCNTKGKHPYARALTRYTRWAKSNRKGRKSLIGRVVDIVALRRICKIYILASVAPVTPIRFPQMRYTCTGNNNRFLSDFHLLRYCHWNLYGKRNKPLVYFDYICYRNLAWTFLRLESVVIFRMRVRPHYIIQET